MFIFHYWELSWTNIHLISYFQSRGKYLLCSPNRFVWSRKSVISIITDILEELGLSIWKIARFIHAYELFHLQSTHALRWRSMMQQRRTHCAKSITHQRFILRAVHSQWRNIMWKLKWNNLLELKIGLAFETPISTTVRLNFHTEV